MSQSSLLVRERRVRELEQELAVVGDGYDRMELVARAGWRAVSCWGEDGWDLGSWPLVVVSHRARDRAFWLMYDVEGDVSVYRFETVEQLFSATDELAFFHWQCEGASWVEGVSSWEAMPERLCGPYSRARAAEVA